MADARAASLSDALKAASGREVTLVNQRKAVVDTTGATVVRQDLGFLRQVLQKLADPNVAFLLLTLGTLGLIYELATPGVGVAGATGATALLLALFSLSVLPVNVVGVLLLLVAAGLFTAELFVPGTAGFAFGGAAVLVLAGVFLFDDAEGISVDLTDDSAAGGGGVGGGCAGRAGGLPCAPPALDEHRSRPLHRTRGAGRRRGGQTGRAFTEGAWWSVRSIGPPLASGSTARVVGIDDLVLLVDPSDTSAGAEAAPPPGTTAHPWAKETS